jgi:hypothetical protein
MVETYHPILTLEKVGLEITLVFYWSIFITLAHGVIFTTLYFLHNLQLLPISWCVFNRKAFLALYDVTLPLILILSIYVG